MPDTHHALGDAVKGGKDVSAQRKRRYVRKQTGCGGQTKVIFRKKAKTTKKIVLKMECTECKHRKELAIKQCINFGSGGNKNRIFKAGSHATEQTGANYNWLSKRLVADVLSKQATSH